MSDIVTLYFSMFRQKASGSNCGMIATEAPSIRGKGSSITAPVIGVLSLSLQNENAKRPTKDVVEW